MSEKVRGVLHVFGFHDWSKWTNPRAVEIRENWTGQEGIVVLAQSKQCKVCNKISCRLLQG